jgi:hemerythrin-like domain-containing protein
MKSNNATYSGFEFEVDGYPALAIINSDLKNLENKSQYPYSVFIELVPDSFNENGHPEDEEYDYLNDVEKKIIEYLEGQTQTVHVGHTTLYRTREIIFYTKDREAVSNFLESFLETIERESSFDIEEDSTWENVSAFYELL